MSILSVSFLFFLSVGAALFHCLPLKLRPYLLLGLNLAFYLSFDWRYFPFLAFTAVSCYLASLLLERINNQGMRKAVFIVFLGVNLFLLFFLKFAPYISQRLFSVFGQESPSVFKNLIVPLGISFYTLQICSYLIDVYRAKYKADRNFLRFFSFCTFFPLMLQGPISRYEHLAPQLFPESKREDVYRDLTFGAQLILWGFFKKLVIADRAAIVVNAVFKTPADHSGFTVVAAVLLYTLQIYTDFSGCVDICRGAAQMFGISLIDNFRRPYFATSIQDFWKRWHISLSGWFRDYLYIPLGGNRKGAVRKYLNVILVFFVSGLWHGVGVHYIVWGLLQGIYQVIGALTRPLKSRLEAVLHVNADEGLWLWGRRAFTLVLVSFSWLIFRANGTLGAIQMLFSIFTPSKGALFPEASSLDLLILLAATSVLLITSYYREKGFGIREVVAKTVLPVRWSLYLLLFVAVLVLGVFGPGFSSSSFIYMNF